jgi:hypothetical protein
MRAYEDVLGAPPVGFASPGRTCDDRALRAFDEAGLRYAVDLDGTAPFRPEGHRHLQLPITRFETIAQMRQRGLSDDAIVDAYIGDLESNVDYCCLYEHPDDLDEAGLAIFERVFAHVRTNLPAPVLLREVAEAWEGRLTSGGT